MAFDQKNGNSSAAGAQLLPWRKIYNGVYHSVGASLVSLTDSSQPAMQRVTALKVDLTQSGIDFRTTPTTGEGNGLTVGTTICNFVDGTPKVVLAINANLSGPPLCTPKPAIATSQLTGLAANEGSVVCNPVEPAPCGGCQDGTPLADVPDSTYVGCTSLMIYKNAGTFSAKIDEATKADPPDLTNLWAAIAGSRNGVASDGVPRQPVGPQIPYLIKDADICTFEQDTVYAGRTGVGVNQDGTLLYLVVVEGLEGTKHPYGATFGDLARWIAAAGENANATADDPGDASTSSVWRAVPLDGGGSSVMAGLDPVSQRAVTFNIQYGTESTPGAQRHVGNYFGIVAAPA